ncbi:uncharacterized protein LOC119560729 [Drosophila subpulchrella]|uniref:uncharacterized protein LOC119560729 n=1 Tax=Drosophila subpulchrella TaxID=1486046 RepID=UPI0018A13550|nr:uncharacterized protein LOC119560729 [Drosophila subpulchrella]
MFKSKSFDLVNEERTKKPERLYQPRRMRWLKYIILPAVFSFALLLILVNVDFSDTSDEVTSNSTDLGCKLESHYNNKMKFLDVCGKSLFISSHGFENNTLQRSFFSSSWELQNLTIVNCTIVHISNETFDQHNTRYLMNLQLINLQLENLTESALQGLQKLQNFTLINGNNHFKPFGFLSAVSETVINARIHQSFYTERRYALSDFLGYNNFSHLKCLDMSGTNFGESIKSDSFENLPALAQLILKNCGLSQIEWDFLPPRPKLVQYLDLSESRKERDYPYNLEIFEFTPDTTIDDEESYTVQIERAAGPPFATATTNSTSAPTTVDSTVTTFPSTLQSITTTSPTQDITADPSTEPSTLSTMTTPRSNCEEELCQELVCSRISADSTIGFTDLESSASCKDGILVEVCESDCTAPTYFCGLFGDNFTSPSNCCSHNTMRCVVSAKASWFDDHSGLVIGLGIGLLLIGSLLGMLIAYGAIRLHPILFKNSKRRESNTMGLIPRRFEKDLNDYAGGPISTLDDSEYVIAYHRYLEQANHRHTETNKYIYPPRDRAPSVPPSCDYPLPLPPRNNYIYESCELYEELP